VLLCSGSSSRGCAAKIGLEPLERRERPAKCSETSLFEDEEHLDWIAVAIRTAEPTLWSLPPQEFATLWTYEGCPAASEVIVRGHRSRSLPLRAATGARKSKEVPTIR